jgi:hypothetical protein
VPFSTLLAVPPNDIEFSGERKRVRCDMKLAWTVHRLRERRGPRESLLLSHLLRRYFSYGPFSQDILVANDECSTVW